MGQKSEWNRAYYGREMGTRQIVIDMQAANPGADPLRDVLTRYGAGRVAAGRRSAASRLSQPPPPGYAAAVHRATSRHRCQWCAQRVLHAAVAGAAARACRATR